MNVLNSINHNHVLHAFVIGLAAGVLAFVLDTYVVSRAETMIGLTPGVL